MTKPCIKCNTRDRYADGRCRPCTIAGNRRWKAENSEKCAGHWRRSREKNRGKRAAASRKYYAEHKEEVAVTMQRYKQQNKETVYACNHRRRARSLAAQGNLSAGDIRSVHAAFPLCLACGTDEDLSLDHVVPLARGGRNDIGNMQVLCMPCNISKGTKTIDYRGNKHEYWRQLELEAGERRI